ncbi:MAG: putative copper resistance protein [Caulobacteraceae bacterium]|nr:putative copper resistance protein [Caulobacteraceae bacterium]
MPAGLVAARAVHYAACTGLFGLSLFALYAVQAPRMRGWLVGLAATALASGGAWFLLVTANLAGRVDAASLAAVAGETSFGPMWIARLLISAALVALALPGPRTTPVVALLAGALLGSIALTGHTQIHEGGLRLVHVASDALHLLGAGAWLGGLIGLSLILGDRTGSSPALRPTVARFSQLAYAAVAALVVSGLVNAFILVGSPAALISTGYGRLLLLKLLFFAGMLALAGLNRFRISPALAGPSANEAARALRRNVLAEQLLAIAVLLCVARLGIGEPPA